MSEPVKLNSAAFTTRCRMTCEGGSEKGSCPCKSPSECEMQSHPLYALAKRHIRTEPKRPWWRFWS